MQKYKEDLIEQVKTGKAQIQVDRDDKWRDLLNYIFTERKGSNVYGDYYMKTKPDNYDWDASPFQNIQIIHAKDFLIQEPEVNWVEVCDHEDMKWQKSILLADLGYKILYRYIIVDIKHIEDYLNGKSNLLFGHYKFMRPIPQPEPLTHKQIEELIGKPFKYIPE